MQYVPIYCRNLDGSAWGNEELFLACVNTDKHSEYCGCGCGEKREECDRQNEEMYRYFQRSEHARKVIAIFHLEARERGHHE